MSPCGFEIKRTDLEGQLEWLVVEILLRGTVCEVKSHKLFGFLLKVALTWPPHQENQKALSAQALGAHARGW